MSKLSHPVSGFARSEFAGVRRAFADNFTRRHEPGGACAIYHHDRPVVNLWGGIRNKRTGEPGEHDTMVVVHSATKGLAAMTLAIAHSRGWLDYEAPVCRYWPEFAQHGKDRITVRQLLAHQAGLFAIDEPVDRSIVADLDRLAEILARQKPAWEPGDRQGYHALTLGFYESELLRRIDPQHRSLGRFFQDEIATPLAIDAYIRVPDGIADARLATLEPPGRLRMLLDFLAAPPIAPRHGFYDECLKGEVRFSLGFMKPSPAWPFGTPSAFGSPGAGGPLGYADPETGVGYACVTSQMGTSLTGDPRDVALRQALDTVASVNRPSAHAA